MNSYLLLLALVVSKTYQCVEFKTHIEESVPSRLCTRWSTVGSMVRPSSRYVTKNDSNRQWPFEQGARAWRIFTITGMLRKIDQDYPVAP